MRLGLILLLCLLNTGCALWRRDREEPVENGPRQQKAEPVLKPSEALKPKSNEMASPVSDLFYMRLTAYSAGVETQMRLDPTIPPVIIIPPPPNQLPGTELVAEDDLGLDDQVEQARLEFDVRMGERNHLRVDYFKLNRFGDVLADQAIGFGDFDFDAGDNIRTKLDWRVLSLTYTYSLFRSERFEAGAGMGLHIIEAKAELSQPGTLNRDSFSEVAPFATIAANAAYRISKRWAVTARGQTFEYSKEDLLGRLSDFHVDIQYRWRKNMAVGIGYTNLHYELEVDNDPPPQIGDQPAFFDLNLKGPELFFRASF
jgi:hypothetical protein